MLAALEKINVDTQIEKKRRIKRANFENEDTRYLRSRNIKTKQHLQYCKKPNQKILILVMNK
jgi:hypothetical protein